MSCADLRAQGNDLHVLAPFCFDYIFVDNMFGLLNIVMKIKLVGIPVPQGRKMHCMGDHRELGNVFNGSLVK